MKLTAKQQRFVDEYLIDLNATQAAIRAGYGTKSAGTEGSRLLANVKVRARVDELMAARSARTGVNQDRVIRELARIAFLDPTRLANMDKATIKDDATEDDRAAISRVRVKHGEDFTEREVQFADKLKALEQLGKHLGMYTENVNLHVEMPCIIDDLR